MASGSNKSIFEFVAAFASIDTFQPTFHHLAAHVMDYNMLEI